MGGACSLKRDPHDDDNIIRRGFSSRHFKFAKSSCLESFLLGRGVDCTPGRSHCPSLMELCVHRIRKDLDKYHSFSMLPSDISQLIFNNLVYSNRLSQDNMEAFRDCALHDIWTGEYNEVKDNWMDVFSSQGSSLLSVYIFGSEVTDFGFSLLKNCPNLQLLSFDCCDRVSEQAIKQVSGLSNLTYLSFRKCVSVTAEAMQALSGLDKLIKLDFERCPQIHGGFVHLRGLSKLESLSIKCCQCIMDSDMEPLAGIASLKELHIVCVYITDYGVSYLRGLNKLAVLNLEGSHVTSSCLDTISELPSLQSLNLNRCRLRDDGCEKFSGNCN
ncbi:toll-like receptor 4 [Capsicum galapagoense]